MEAPILTSYVLAIGHEAGWRIPEETREKMEAGLKKFIEGSITQGFTHPNCGSLHQKIVGHGGIITEAGKLNANY